MPTNPVFSAAPIAAVRDGASSPAQFLPDVAKMIAERGPITFVALKKGAVARFIEHGDDL